MVTTPKDDRAKLERQIQSKIDSGDLGAAATLIVRDYGPEIHGFLAARLRNETAAADAFSMFSEDLWRGLPRFEGRSTVRVWAYTIARHAALRLQAAPHGKPRRNVPLSAPEALSKLVERVRTDTAPFVKTEFKTEVAKLRNALSDEDRTLLVLRVDRGLDWTDVARVFLGPETVPSARALSAETARLRKRFQLVKAKIRRLASESRALRPEDP